MVLESPVTKSALFDEKRPFGGRKKMVVLGEIRGVLEGLFLTMRENRCDFAHIRGLFWNQLLPSNDAGIL
jgi:hypothetical protein